MTEDRDRERVAALEARVSVLEERDRSLSSALTELRDHVLRIEARMWWLVTSAAGVGGAVGTGVANVLGG